MVAYTGCWLAEAYAALHYFTLDDGADSAAQQTRQIPIGVAAAVALVVISLAAASSMRRRQLVLLALAGSLVGLELLLRNGVQSMSGLPMATLLGASAVCIPIALRRPQRERKNRPDVDPLR